jgi:hypothetical protein
VVVWNMCRSRCQQEGFNGNDGGGFVRMRCWSSWWLVRTYFQAFGQPFFEDLSTDEANLITILMWPVMNLVLVNLLIAIMNDTFVDVKDHSKLEWMIEMHNLAKEYRCESKACKACNACGAGSGRVACGPYVVRACRLT